MQQYWYLYYIFISYESSINSDGQEMSYTHDIHVIKLDLEHIESQAAKITVIWLLGAALFPVVQKTWQIEVQSSSCQSICVVADTLFV